MIRGPTSAGSMLEAEPVAVAACVPDCMLHLTRLDILHRALSQPHVTCRTLGCAWYVLHKRATQTV